MSTNTNAHCIAALPISANSPHKKEEEKSTFWTSNDICRSHLSPSSRSRKWTEIIQKETAQKIEKQYGKKTVSYSDWRQNTIEESSLPPLPDDTVSSSHASADLKQNYEIVDDDTMSFPSLPSSYPRLLMTQSDGSLPSLPSLPSSSSFSSALDGIGGALEGIGGLLQTFEKNIPHSDWRQNLIELSPLPDDTVSLSHASAELKQNCEIKDDDTMLLPEYTPQCESDDDFAIDSALDGIRGALDRIGQTFDNNESDELQLNEQIEQEADDECFQRCQQLSDEARLKRIRNIEETARLMRNKYDK